MPYVDLSRWSEFLNRIRDAEAALGSPSLLWYRGVRDARYSLVPSLLRRSNGIEKERELFGKYCSLSMLVDRERSSDWRSLFDMQHYGLPTRLLDWTEVLGVAAFFAMVGDTVGDAAVYVLDPLALNRESSRTAIPRVDESREGFDYRTIYLDHKPLPPIRPIAVEAPAQNARIAAQHGKFTIHGTDSRPIDTQFPNAVKKVLLPEGTKHGAREFMRISGINEFTVFPDIVGLVPFIEALVGLKS